MKESKMLIARLYKNINKLDEQIINLKKRENALAKKISKIKSSKEINRCVDLAEEIIDSIHVLEKKKSIMIAHMATLTPIVKIDLLEDPYIGTIVNNGKVDKDDLTSNYLYGCVAYGYTIFSTKRIPNIHQKMTLDEFEKSNLQPSKRRIFHKK